MFVFLFLGTSRKIKLYHTVFNIDQTNRMRNLPLILISTTIKVLHFVWKHKTWFGCCHYAHILVSNIQFKTKRIERVVAQQFNNHFTANLHYIDRIWTYTERKWLYSIGSDITDHNLFLKCVVCLFVCLFGFFVSHDIFSLIWRCYYYRWKTKVWPIRGVNDHRAVRIL